MWQMPGVAATISKEMEMNKVASTLRLSLLALYFTVIGLSTVVPKASAGGGMCMPGQDVCAVIEVDGSPVWLIEFKYPAIPLE
ncbi:MAG: hypothetical protein AAGA65_26645 [Actinomycetota bacterium]